MKFVLIILGLALIAAAVVSAVAGVILLAIGWFMGRR